MQLLHHLTSPLITLLLALWAAWLSFAQEADAEVPRILADQVGMHGTRLSPARKLFVGHLAVLILAGAAAGIAEAWWSWAPAGAIVRLLLAVLFVWVVSSVLPRLLASVAPDLPPLVRPAALRTLRPFEMVFRLVAWADQKLRPAERPTRASEAGPARRDMLLGLFSLADMTVAEVMTPRIDVVAVDTEASTEEVVATLRRSEHARLLVYEGQPDAVVGVLFAKDMLAWLPEHGEGGDWHTLIRPAAYVPEGKTLDRQLRDFQRGASHLAVVVDEFGGTAGIITLEDVLEEVVGEIQDEHDVDEQAAVVEDAEGRLSVEGGVPLAELEALLGHSFGREDVATVGGLILDAFGRVPRGGERIEVDGIDIMVELVARRRVRRVLVTRPARAATPAEREGA